MALRFADDRRAGNRSTGIIPINGLSDGEFRRVLYIYVSFKIILTDF